jgi:sec-independent protein translocase protein TatA
MLPQIIGGLGAPEILLILAVLVLLFGASKLPELARGSGRALRIFKAETKGLMDDDDEVAKTDTQRSPEQRELESRPPSLDAESERQAAERRAAEHRDDPA